MKISRIARLSDSELLREVLRTGTGDEGSDGTFKPGELIMSALRFSEEEFREKLSQFVRKRVLQTHICMYSTPYAESQGPVAD
ncbi:MAG: hypothetical protein R2758_11495 [Bacteroidales bacterium]